MRSLISVATVAGLLLGVGLLGAQQKKKDSDSKPKDFDSKSKESDYKKKKKEQDENFKKDFDKRKRDVTGQLVGGRSLRAWINDLSLPDASIKENAMKTIAASWGIWGGEAIPKLIPLLKSRDAGIQVNACIAIGEINLHDQTSETAQLAVKELREVLNDREAYVRFHAALALGRVATTTDARSALPRLADMVTRDYGSWEVRRAAALALATVGIDFDVGTPDPRAINALISALGDSCSQVRLQSLVSLGSLGTPKRPLDHQNVKRAVENAFNNPKQNPVVVIWARVLWVQYFSKSKEKIKNEPTHFGEIAKMLKSPYEVNVRVNAAQALATLQAKMAIRHLIDVVKNDSEEQAGLAAANALAAMADQIKDEQIRSLAEVMGPSEKKEFRIRGPQVLAMFGKKAEPALDDLIAALREQEKQIDKDGKVKDKEFIIAVIDCFGAMDRAAFRARPDLQRLSQHRDDDIQYAARQVLKFWQNLPAAARAAPPEKAEGSR